MSINTKGQTSKTTRLDKLAPAPLKYPAGGGLKRASATNLKKAEVNLMEARHAFEKLQLQAKHAAPKNPRPAKSSRA